MVGVTGGTQAVSSIAMTDYPIPAGRPRNSTLSANKIETTFRLRIPPWQEATFEILEKLVRNDIP